MSTKAEIDQVWNQMQQGVRRMRPLVVEQQPERDMRFPKPAMVVQERCSRSSYLERMEKYWTERWIEIALASGTSMEEIEEIRAMTNYDRPVRTLEEERMARLEMLEECRRMLDRWDEEDEAKKHHEKVSLVAGDSGSIVSDDGGFVKNVCVILKPNKLKTLQEKYEPETETLLFEEDNSLDIEMDGCASQVFDQIPKRRKNVAKKKKRWKKHSPDIEDHLDDVWSYEEKDNFERLGIQMENTSKRLRNSLLKWCKGLSCHWMHTRQTVDRKWLLMFRKKKKKRMTEIAKNYGTYDRSERCKKAKRGLLSVMTRWLHHHEEGTAEKVNKETSIAIEILTGQLTRQRLLSLKVTVKKQKSKRLLQQHRKKCIKSIKEEDHCRSMRKGKRVYEMKRSKLELEQLKLMQEHNKALKKLKKWIKNKSKQKNQKESMKLDGAVMKIKRLLAATMTKRVELRFECMVQGKLLSFFKIGWTKILWNWKKRKINYMRQNIKCIMTARFGDHKVSLRDARMGYKVTKFKHELETEQLLQGRKKGLKKLAKWMRRKLKFSHSFEWNHPINLLKAWGEQSKKRPSGNYIAVMWNLKRGLDLSRKKHRYKQRYNKNQWLHMVEKMITATAAGKQIYLLLQSNEGSEHVISSEWDPGGAGSGQVDRIVRVGSYEGRGLLTCSENQDIRWKTKCKRSVFLSLHQDIECSSLGEWSGNLKGILMLDHYQGTRLVKITSQAIRATDRGTKGRVIRIGMFENLMKLSSKIQKECGISFRVMELYKVTKTVTSYDSWMTSSFTPNMCTGDALREIRGNEFRTEPFKKPEFRWFTCDWLHPPRITEMLLCSSYQTAIQACKEAAWWVTTEETMVDKLGVARKRSMLKNLCYYLMQRSENDIMEVTSRWAEAKSSGIDTVHECYYVTREPLSSEMNSGFEMLRKQRFETWSEEVSWKEHVVRKCLEDGKVVLCFNLGDKVELKGGSIDKSSIFKEGKWSLTLD